LLSLVGKRRRTDESMFARVGWSSSKALVEAAGGARPLSGNKTHYALAPGGRMGAGRI